MGVFMVQYGLTLSRPSKIPTLKYHTKMKRSHPEVATIPGQLLNNLQDNEDFLLKLNEAEEEFHGWLDDMALYEDANDDSNDGTI